MARDLITEEHAESGKVTVVSQDVTSFDLDWLTLQVTQDLFSAHTTDPSRYPALQELVLGIFSFLEYTPLKMLGLNRQMHFKVDSEDRWHELGDELAPKEPWKDVLSGPRADGSPGLRSLTMEGNRDGSDADYLRVKLEPSLKVNPGIYVETNEHYALAEEKPAKELMQTLEAAWSDAQGFALTVATRLLGGKAT